MSIKKTLGGDRLGSGKKMQVDLHGFSRSSHDLGRIWRSTMSAGTLVPYLVEYALPGDVFNIDLDADVKTYPTLGPLFGSFKLQLDVFQAPLRLYNAQLHNNALGIGMNMSRIKLPQLEFKWTADDHQEEGLKEHFYGKHINSSSIHAYLGIRGLGSSNGGNKEKITAQFNAIPYLAYWDIYKNYYANKQEEIGVVVSGSTSTFTGASIEDHMFSGIFEATQHDGICDFRFAEDFSTFSNEMVRQITLNGKITSLEDFYRWDYLTKKWYSMSELEGHEEAGISVTYLENSVNIIFDDNLFKMYEFTKIKLIGYDKSEESINLKKFPLKNIDEMREEILAKSGTSPMIINSESKVPYGSSLKELTYLGYRDIADLDTVTSILSQEGLGIKTYQSDIFNNWLSTDWIDGTNGINEITAVDTSEGSFNIDTLNLANKVYDMLNRIAVSGGSYDDWIEANWSHQAYRRTESPIYHGGLSKEIVFQEVVSNADTVVDNENRPLGTLAGKGGLSNKKKGGKVTIKVHEPSVIIGIVSITPRIDYSQGNEWHINLQTMDDFHKPGLDEIGFQELITEQMASWDVMRYGDGEVVRKSAGKQPAWINYMTSFNRTYGYFADPDKEMYMTLNRRYEYDENGIKDLTTYIDPSKYNYLFAVKELSAMNFWLQIGADITARRKMSAKVMPNL